MPLFTYKALDQKGIIIEETIQASNKYDAVAFLRAEGLKVLSIQSLESAFSPWSKKVSTSDKAAFCRFMATMLRAGLSLHEGVEIIKQETENRRLKKILADIAFQTRKGKNLSVVLTNYRDVFDPVFITIIKAGEESGTLEQAFDYLANQLLSSYEFSQKIKSSLMYPAVIVMAMFGVGTMMLVVVLPKIAEAFLKMNIKIPTLTKIILQFGLFVGKNTTLVLVSMLGLFLTLFLFFYLETTRNLIIKLISKLPLVKKMMNQIDVARFARTLAVLLRSGVPIIDALEVASSSLTQPQLKNQAKKFTIGVSKGQSLSHVLAEAQVQFPMIMIQTIKTGEKSGSLEEVLQDLADFYEREVEFQLKRITTLIEPILMLLIGIVVGTMVILIIAPIYSIIGGLQETIKR